MLYFTSSDSLDTQEKLAVCLVVDVLVGITVAMEFFCLLLGFLGFSCSFFLVWEKVEGAVA